MFKQYVKNEQFNLQINRFINDEYENDQKVQEDLKSIIPQLKDEESWFKAWNDKAIAREQDGDFSVASTYYQASEFYLSPEDAQKSINWTIFIQLIRRHLRYDCDYKN